MSGKTRTRMHTVARWLAGSSLPRYGADGIAPDARGIHKAFPKLAFVAGYDTGGWPWTAEDWGLFPHADRVHIVTTASKNEGDVLDVETGDASPAQVEGWVAMRKASGYYKPTIYCSLNVVPAVRAGAGKWKLGIDYDLWVAHYTGKPHLAYPGSVATQYADPGPWDNDVAYSKAWPERKAPAPKIVRVPLTRHVATGTVSLLTASKGYRVSADAIVHCSLTHEKTENIDRLIRYLTSGNGPSDTMPAGLVYWVPGHKEKK